ncbi:MAG: methyltransferase domain-containing protein [Nibricoccus sp.]
MAHFAKSLLKKSADLQRVNDWLKAIRSKASRSKPIREYWKTHRERKLHLGCGSNVLDGWLNTDQFTSEARVIYLDLTKPFPFPDSSFDYILAEHTIEHIERRDASRMLAECYRVLRQKGVLRVATPDLPKYLALYGPNPSDIEQQCITDIGRSWIIPGFHRAVNYTPTAEDYSSTFAINDIFLNYEHRFIYDFELLERMCRAAGFDRCEKGSAGKSSHAPFNGVETHTSRVEAHLTLTVEATKSAPV